MSNDPYDVEAHELFMYITNTGTLYPMRKQIWLNQYIHPTGQFLAYQHLLMIGYHMFLKDQGAILPARSLMNAVIMLYDNDQEHFNE